MSETTEAKKKREPRKIERLTLRDRSAMPGAWLCDAMCLRHPFEEDLAILEMWNPALSLKVTYASY